LSETRQPPFEILDLGEIIKIEEIINHLYKLTFLKERTNGENMA